MKNFKISKTKTDLSEEQVEKLYKEYGKIDSKQKKFKGTHREYVNKVGGMIDHWLDSVLSKRLSGSGYKEDLEEILTLKRTEKERLVSSGDDTYDIDEEIKNIEKKLKIDRKVGKLYPLKEEMFNPVNKQISGTKPHVRERAYLEIPYDKVENPFLSKKPGFKTYLPGGTPRDKYSAMIDKLVQFEVIFSCLSDDVTARKNMLVLLPFEHIFELTPIGSKQRKIFSQHLASIGRSTIYGSEEWNDASEASYRTEKFVFEKYISKGITDPTELMIEQFKILGKILSLEMYQNRVDFIFDFFTGDSKGKKSYDAIGSYTARPLQVNLHKIMSVIFNSIDPETNVIGNPRILFTVYKSNNDINDYDESAPRGDEEGKDKLPFEIIAELDIKKILDLPGNEAYKRRIIRQFKHYETLTPGGKQQMLNNHVTINQYLLPATKNFFGVPQDKNWLITGRDDCLNIPLTPMEVTPSMDQERGAIINAMCNKVKIIGYAKSLFPDLKEDEWPSPKDYGNLFLADNERGLDIIRDFQGEDKDNFEFKEPGNIHDIDFDIPPIINLEGVRMDEGQRMSEGQMIAAEVERIVDESKKTTDKLTKSSFGTTKASRIARINVLKKERPELFPVTTGITGPPRLPPPLPVVRTEEDIAIDEEVKKLVENADKTVEKLTPESFGSTTSEKKARIASIKIARPELFPGYIPPVKRSITRAEIGTDVGLLQAKTKALGIPLEKINSLDPTRSQKTQLQDLVLEKLGAKLKEGSTTIYEYLENVPDTTTTSSGRGKPRKVGKGDDEDLAVMRAHDKVEELNLLFDVLMDKGVLTDEAAKIAEELSEAEEELEAAIKYKKYKDEKDKKINDLERNITYEEYKEDQLTRSYQRFLNERERRVASKVLTEKMDIAMRERENQFVKDIHEVQRRLKESRLELAKIQPRRPVKTKKPKGAMAALSEEDESKSGDGGLTPKTPEGGKYIKKVVKYYR